jgi:hypothetical protein
VRAVFVLALVACSPPPPDPAVGRWRGEADPACTARQRWHRNGAIVTLERARISGSPCTCRIERIDVELRGDELVFGREHAQRVN